MVGGTTVTLFGGGFVRNTRLAVRFADATGEARPLWFCFIPLRILVLWPPCLRSLGAHNVQLTPTSAELVPDCFR